MPPSLFRTYELNLRNVTCLIEKKMQMLTLGGQYPVLTRENPHPRRGFPAHCLTADPLCPMKSLHTPEVLNDFQDQNIIICIPMFILSIFFQNTVSILLSRWYILVPRFSVI
jgi:hypothetical protein